jgi:hypothetical protein
VFSRIDHTPRTTPWQARVALLADLEVSLRQPIFADDLQEMLRAGDRHIVPSRPQSMHTLREQGSLSTSTPVAPGTRDAAV